MRRYNFDPQPSLFVKPIGEIEFDVFSRHELLPILMALQYLYVNETDRLREILEKIEQDIKPHSASNKGRSGMSCWETLILVSLRLGCNLDYDQLADLATNHRKIQGMLGYGELDQKRFARSTIHDNLKLLKSETMDQLLSIIIDLAHEQCFGALERVRADTFVVKKNIHYPTDTNLLYDGTRKIIEISVKLSDRFNLPGWRKHEYFRCKIKGIQQEICKVARSRRTDRDERLKVLCVRMIEAAAVISSKAEETLACLTAMIKAENRKLEQYWEGWVAELHYYIAGTEYVSQLAERRMINGEKIPNPEKVFSLFEPDTELINRGKTPNPIEFGHRVLIVQDRAGFIIHSQMLDIGFTDEKIITEVMRNLQRRFNDRIKTVSFDKGFWTPNNLVDLTELFDLVILPKKGKLSEQDKQRQNDKEYKKVRKWHSGVESAIGALVFANGLGKCRDKGRDGYTRYLAMAVLGRNLQTFGNILVEREKRKRKTKSTLLDLVA
jgi:hypothetical protein